MPRILTIRVLRPIVVGVQRFDVGTVLEVPELYQHGVEHVHANPKQEGGPRVEILSASGVESKFEDFTTVPAVVLNAEGVAHLVKNPHPPQNISDHLPPATSRSATLATSSRPACDGSAWRGI